ncbi:flavodoxin domain-containing protein [Lentibacillus sp. CBA3610]|uniref:flavodoxin domain-containing protein n=1 Tax=Lentibacillus sp. CBA3610 TaxID=2518176 RepID=UPI0015953192|nr:flavodoxin domain-containing protein [Lentibacillus sp. CBA3610]QKY70037.1 flavodoxin [Lentibacillus sp. CBA3610]
MAKVLVLYASLTGSTEIMAEEMTNHLKEKGHDVEHKSFDLDPIDAQRLEEFDSILFGSYSWDDDIPFEVEDFYFDMDDVDLTGKTVGVFGSCDTYYDIYGPAIDTLAAKSQERNATVYEEKFKFELEPDDKDIDHGFEFADAVINLGAK